jgi:mRNA-degrading endonuclease toxin of MazEF toxin-antitoxin module
LAVVSNPGPRRDEVWLVEFDPTQGSDLRAVDRQRLVRKLGTVQTKTAEAVSSVLVEMFTRE